MANIYQKRDAVTKDIDHFWLKVVSICLFNVDVYVFILILFFEIVVNVLFTLFLCLCSS